LFSFKAASKCAIVTFLSTKSSDFFGYILDYFFSSSLV